MEDVPEPASPRLPGDEVRVRFYALHSPPGPDEGFDRPIWEIDTATSGGRHGLVLGVVAGYGRVLVGTRGWRARFATTLALYTGPTVTDHTREVGAAATAHRVPLYRDLDAIVAEWGPDRELVDRLTA